MVSPHLHTSSASRSERSSTGTQRSHDAVGLTYHNALPGTGSIRIVLRTTPSSAFRCSGFRYHPDTTMRRPQHCCVSQLPLTTPVQTASKNSKRLAINALERQLVCPDAGRRAVGDGISRRDLPRPVTDHNERPSAQSKCCLLYTSPSPRDGLLSRMPSSA